MKFMSALLVKFIISAAAFTIGLDLFFDASFTEILAFSFFNVVFTYILADRIVLSRVGNWNTLLLEFSLSYLLVWVFGSVLLHSYLQVAWGSFISAGIITAGEVLVHKFFYSPVYLKQMKPETQPSINRGLLYGTEFSDELDPGDK
ncbi:YndM family protein [Peribacillus sp. SCS-37]|uniref:YndM family protein n=1 Tax=Paraperibacillus esterisolvens TaxID=3115296 RepID=UPI00390629F0